MMTDSQSSENPTQNTPESGDQPNISSVEAIQQKFEALQQKFEAAQAKADESFNRAARAMAESENIRRQADRDIEKAHKFALESFVKSLLPVMDTLERALDFDPKDTASSDIEIMREGIKLTLKMFLDTLTKFGVEQLDPLDQPFNPELHEALSMAPCPDKKPNHILQVVQKGYVLNGRIARRARVITVKAG